MTIEKSPSPTANASSSAASANRSEGKGKTGSDDGSGGFGAILSAVDNAPAASETATDTPADGKSAKGAKNGKAASDSTVVDPNTLLQQNPQIAAAQAQAAADAATAAAAQAQGAGTAQTAADPAALAQQAALNAAPQTGADLSATQGATASNALPGAARAAGRGIAGAPDSTVSLDTSAPAGTKASSAQGLLQAHAKAGKDALQTGLDANAQASQTSLSGSTASNQAAGAERADAAKFMASLQQAQAPQGNRAAETALAPLVAKTDKPQSERSSSVKGADPTYSGSALGVSSPDFSQTAATQVGAVPPETQVAEQVSYWVTHNVQNAELQLDGLGKDPVAVSISVQGNEAQISFRSDESATRDILQNSGAHLKDLLQREGLVLTGVSVGSSGSQSAQSRGDQSGRQNARQTTIAPLQVASQDTTPRLRSGMAGSAGRSVDLFV